MDSHYDAQISPTRGGGRGGGRVSFSGGPARQFGSGAAGLGALAVRVGRSTLPLLAKYALPLVKKVGRNIITAAIPELGEALRGRKKLKSAVKSTVKKGITRAVEQSLQFKGPPRGGGFRPPSANASGRRGAARTAGAARAGGSRARVKINSSSQKSLSTQNSRNSFSKSQPTKRSRSSSSSADILKRIKYQDLQ